MTQYVLWRLAEEVSYWNELLEEKEEEGEWMNEKWREGEMSKLTWFEMNTGLCGDEVEGVGEEKYDEEEGGERD